MADIHWQCSVNQVNAEKDGPAKMLAESEQLTVGQEFVLVCEGPEVASLNAQTATLELPKEQQYALRVLKNLGMDSHKASFVATSYLVKPDGHKFSNIFLTDGTNRVALDGISFKVKSVITKENNPQNQPFPPWGPFAFGYPTWIWLTFAIILAFFSSFIIEGIIGRYQRRRFLRTLKNNPPILSAYHQFAKELRHMGRDRLRPQSFDAAAAKEFVEDLHSKFRWYLSRTLIISCFDERASQVMRNIKKKFPDLFKKVNRSLSVALLEVERVRERPTKMSVADANQILDLVRTAVEDLQKNAVSKSENKLMRSRLEAEA